MRISRYTIELEHGDFRWQVVRNYSDFQMLNNRLRLHRIREKIMAAIRRTRDRVDSYLESWGVDVIPDHKEDCPYYTHPGQIPKKKSRQYQHKPESLKLPKAQRALVLMKPQQSTPRPESPLREGRDERGPGKSTDCHPSP
ncbi:hypothetical protein WR25_19541 [Diploscapter pachys]|uniref:PX domain-containing protein n=1 Tax=Diploscapter pachys TaxID=2018661 RepID=A0A2A2JEG8_9BILA|nr:hypothetical protein WR25_19541 [Diploscapter pachys]